MDTCTNLKKGYCILGPDINAEHILRDDSGWCLCSDDNDECDCYNTHPTPIPKKPENNNPDIQTDINIHKNTIKRILDNHSHVPFFLVDQVIANVNEIIKLVKSDK